MGGPAEKITQAPTDEDRKEVAAIVALLDEGPFEVLSAFATEAPKPRVGEDYGFFFHDRRGPEGRSAICISKEVRYTKGHPGSRLRFARRVEDDLYKWLQRRRDREHG